jgi:hypothetical protein
MDVLSHYQLSITMDLYSHVMPTALRDAADAMDRALNAGQWLSSVAVTVAVRAGLMMTIFGWNCLWLGAPRGNRTPNPLIKSQLLCQLS